MQWLISAGFLIGLCALIASSRHFRRAKKFPYAKSKSLFSPTEKKFLKNLEPSIKDRFRVYGKVRIADVIDVLPINNRSAEQTALNKIAAKHFDFVLCEKGSLEIIAAIELDDSSHNRKDRIARDKFVNEVCLVGNLPLIRFKALSYYEQDKIRAQILHVLNKHGNAHI